ncbi:MAG: phosphatase PAP2 family protein [Candidatus Dormibacteraeota bacterium]|nr:phosphatase PAP2 family protein [Candidatus Dormibacteraeota bacterium]
MNLLARPDGNITVPTRPWLAGLAGASLVLFVINTFLVATRPRLGFDLPLALAVQRTAWGPVAAAMTATNAIAGWLQVLVGAVAILGLALWDRRAAWLAAIGAVANLWDSVVKLGLQRHRPTPDLVHVFSPVAGYSYPSGHAVFFTWLGLMAAFAGAPKLRSRYRPPVWLAAVLLVATACLGRVWVGAHWPSDVVGGVLLATAWCAFVLWLPDRWLRQPSLGWLARLSRSRTDSTGP